ncbi:hypothetical protein BKA70DRAFT_1268486 [Coprinopsis sp. MPI-PUGE-AT-0042]|nr:hypothetical protein BKA70DRAFT_1268486 [Coprinopsis sp. MPI-PUGE-AT-0042]
MPKFSSVFEETSPFFVYGGPGWEPGDSRSEKNANRYSAASWNASRLSNATVSFEYYGSKVTISGSRRINHGTHRVSIDGEWRPAESSNVESEDLEEFQTTLFEEVVENGQHRVTMVNLEDKWVDVDFFGWETEIGKPDEELFVNTVQDSSSLWTYEPSGEWGAPSERVGTFSGGSGHATTSAGATAELRFSGDCIAVYGPVGPEASSYTVQVNGNPAKSFNANYPRYYTKQLLFWVGGLGNGNHTLKFAKDAVSNRELAIDYAEIYTTRSLGGVDLVAGESTLAPQAVNKTSTPLLAALGVVSGVALISLILHAILFFRHRKRRATGGPVDIDIASTARSRRTSMSMSPFLVNASHANIQPQMSPFPVSNSQPHIQPQLSQSRSHTFQKSAETTRLEMRPEYLESPPAYTNGAGSSSATTRS